MNKRPLCEIVGDAEHEDSGEGAEVEVTVKVKGPKAAPAKADEKRAPAKVQEDKAGRQLLLG